MTATGCQRLPQTATNCHRLPQTATDCHRLPKNATKYHRLSHWVPQAATDCYRLPQNTKDWLRLHNLGNLFGLLGTLLGHFNTLSQYMGLLRTFLDCWVRPLEQILTTTWGYLGIIICPEYKLPPRILRYAISTLNIFTLSGSWDEEHPRLFQRKLIF